MRISHCFSWVIISVVSVLQILLTSPAHADDCGALLGQWAYGSSYAVEVAGDFAYFGSGRYLQVANIAQLEKPRVVGETLLPEIPRQIVLWESYAFVSTGAAGLRVVDVSSPSQPTEIGSWTGTDFVRRVALSDGLAFVVDAGRGLWILDISDPSSPVEVGFFEASGLARDVVVNEGVAYLVHKYAGLRIIDVSIPEIPVEIGHLHSGSSFDFVDYFDGHVIAVSYYGALSVVDVRTPEDPVAVGSYYVERDIEVHGLTLFRGQAYLTYGSRRPDDHPSGEFGVRVVQISEPESPVEVEFFLTPGHASGLTVSNYVAFVADGEAGLRIIRMPRYTLSSEISDIPVKGSFAAVALSKGYVFASDHGGLLWVFDIRSPENPTHISTYETGGEIEDLVVSGSYLYVSDPTMGLRVIEIGSPHTLAEVGSVEIEGGAFGLATEGSFIYTTGMENGLWIIDAGTPQDPVVVGRYDTFDLARNVAVSENYAYVADDLGGLRIIDIGEPTAPEEVGFYRQANPWGLPSPWYALDVAVKGNYAYVASDTYGLSTLDVSDPTKPVFLGGSLLGGAAFRIALSGDFAYVAERRFTYGGDTLTGLHIYEISIPESPGWVAQSSFEGIVADVSTGDEIVAFASSDSGLGIFRPCPEGFGQCSPIYVAAAASGPGGGSSVWASEVTVNNRGEEDLMFRFQPIPRGTDGAEARYSIQFPLAPNTSLGLGDVWQTLTQDEGAGAINVCVSDPDAAIVTSRTYATIEAGTYGQSIDGVKADSGKIITEAETARLGFLTENDNFRSNIGVVNISPVPIVIAADFYRADGTPLGRRMVTLEPYSNDQINQALRRVSDEDIDLAYVDLLSSTEGAAFLAYASVVDNRTDDPTTVWPFEPGNGFGVKSSDCTPIWVAAAMSGEGDNQTRWATDLNVTNLGSEMISYRFQLLPRGEDNSQTPYSDLFNLEGNASVTYSDVWQSLSGGEGSGAVNVCVDDQQAAGVISRTYNTGEEGTFGQTIVGVAGAPPAKVSTGERARLIGLKENEDFRTNIGFLNAGNEQIGVVAEFFDDTGNSLGVTWIILPPYSSGQWNRAFSRDPIGAENINQGFVDLWSETENAEFLAYASVVDNGTGDPITVWPKK